MGVTRAWVEKGEVAQWLGLIWVHLLMLLIWWLLSNRLPLQRKWQHLRQKGQPAS